MSSVTELVQQVSKICGNSMGYRLGLASNIITMRCVTQAGRQPRYHPSFIIGSPAILHILKLIPAILGYARYLCRRVHGVARSIA